MTWNHRVCKETFIHDSTSDKTISYEIREVHYNADGEVCLVTENAIAGIATVEEFGNSTEAEALAELSGTLKRMQDCLSEPVLDIDTIKYANMDSE